MIIVLISGLSFANAATNYIGGGTITFVGYIVEPQCKVQVSNTERVNFECYRNGKNLTKTSSLKEAKKLSLSYVKVKYSQYKNKPMLNITYN
ncbi:hypothetical protein PROVRUST_05302 [Providencia rustigianii DSM 4541]|nr:hypothetical protein PROVRUST_05302 [Providencia rustigianii DSM 4541]